MRDEERERRQALVFRVLQIFQEDADGAPNQGAHVMTALEDVVVNCIVAAANPGAEMVMAEKLAATVRKRLPRAILRAARPAGTA